MLNRKPVVLASSLLAVLLALLLTGCGISVQKARTQEIQSIQDRCGHKWRRQS